MFSNLLASPVELHLRRSFSTLILNQNTLLPRLEPFPEPLPRSVVKDRIDHRLGKPGELPGKGRDLSAFLVAGQLIRLGEDRQHRDARLTQPGTGFEVHRDADMPHINEPDDPLQVLPLLAVVEDERRPAYPLPSPGTRIPVSGQVGPVDRFRNLEKVDADGGARPFRGAGEPVIGAHVVEKG